MFPPVKGAMGAMGACRIRTTVPVDGVLRKMGVGEQVGLHNSVCRNKTRWRLECVQLRPPRGKGRLTIYLFPIRSVSVRTHFAFVRAGIKPHVYY